MTVSSQTSSVSYLGDGVTTLLPIPYYFLEQTHLRVTRVNADTSVNILSLGADYSVSGAGNEAGGAVTMFLPPALGVKTIIDRAVPATQETNYVANDPFPAESHERALDKLTMLVQQGISVNSRSLKVPPSDPEPADLPNVIGRADKYLSFDTAGNPIAVAPVSGTAGDLAILLASTAVGNGDAMIGVKQPYTGSVSRTQHDKNLEFVTAADFGAFGLGADETVQLKAARDANAGPIELMAGRTYRISSQIAATGHGQGFFVRDGGWATVIMLTGAGQFDRSTYAGSRFDANACGFYSLNFNDYVCQGIRFTLDSPVAVRTCKALAVRGGKGARINVEAFGFKECENGIVCVDSISEGVVVAWLHDCGTSNDTLASMQVTGLDLDNVRLVSGTPIATTHSYIRVVAERLLLSGAALTKYGMQTDAFNNSGSGALNYGVFADISATDVGEAADIFGSHMVIKLSAFRCWVYGLKVIHGARHNIIDATIDTTGGAAVVLGSSNTATQTVAFNDIRATVANAGNLASSGLVKCAFQTDGNTATYKPEYNKVSIRARQGGNMAYVVSDESGSNNVYEYDCDVAQVSEVTGISTALNVIRRISSRGEGYASLRYYGGGFTNLPSTAPQALAANTLYFVPFRVTDGKSFPSIGVSITTVGSGGMRFGVWRMQGGIPTTLVAQTSSVSNTASGVSGASFSAGGVFLPPGLYALSVCSDTTMSVQSSPLNAVIAAEVGLSTPAGNDCVRQAPFTYGGLPNVAPSVSWNNINLPNIWLRG